MRASLLLLLLSAPLFGCPSNRSSGDDDDSASDDDDTATDDDDTVGDDDDATGCPQVTGIIELPQPPPEGMVPGPIGIGAFLAADLENGYPIGEPLDGTQDKAPTFPYSYIFCSPPAGTTYTLLAVHDINDGKVCSPGDLVGRMEVTVPAGGAPFDAGSLTMDELVGPDGCRREEPPPAAK